MTGSILAGGSIRILWDEDDSAEVTITGGNAVFTVGGLAATFPYTLTSSTTFSTAQSGVYTVSVQHYGYEIAGTPDGTRQVTLRFGEEEIFAPTPDSRATGTGLGAMVRDIVSTDVPDSGTDIGAAVAAALAGASAGVGAADKGDGFMAKLDQKQTTATIAILSDSTGYKNGSGNYVGTDGREWPKKLAKWIGDTFTTAKVNYHLLSSASPITYAATEVIDDGKTLTTVFSDGFDRTAADLVGSTPDIGSAWAGTASRYSLPGDSTATYGTSAGQTYGTCTTAGYLKTTRVDTINSEYASAGIIWLISSRVNNGTYLAIKITPLGDTIEFGVSYSSVFTTLTGYTGTFAAAGIPAVGTANDVTMSIEHKSDGTVVFTVGTLTYTHTLAAGQSDVFKTATGVGLSGGIPGHKIKSITTTAAVDPTTTVEVYNGSMSSKDAQWSQAGYASLVPVAPDVIVISHSHNHEAETAATFEAALDGLIGTARAAHPSAAIVIMSQNPESSAAANYVAHTTRVQDLRRYARTKGYGYLPAHEAFMAQGNPTSLLNVDGIHPTTTGIDLIGTAATAYFDRLSLQP